MHERPLQAAAQIVALYLTVALAMFRPLPVRMRQDMRGYGLLGLTVRRGVEHQTKLVSVTLQDTCKLRQKFSFNAVKRHDSYRLGNSELVHGNNSLGLVGSDSSLESATALV